MAYFHSQIQIPIVIQIPILFLLLPPANVVCEGYVFTGVYLSTVGEGLPQCMLGDPPARETPLNPLPGRPPSRETPLPGRLPCQRDPPARETPFPPSRPTPKGEIEGDQVQAHTQGGN